MRTTLGPRQACDVIGQAYCHAREQVFSSELRASKFTFLRVTGMVLAGALEAMSTGTPVIARRHGSAPEVIDHEISGLVVDSIDEAVSAMDRIRAMSRARVRRC